MINTLTKKYIDDLLNSFNGLSNKVQTDETNIEKKALVYGNGSPVYLHKGRLPENTTDATGYTVDSFTKTLNPSQVTPPLYIYDVDVMTVIAGEDNVKVTFNDFDGTVIVNGEEVTLSSGDAITVPSKENSTLIIDGTSHTITYNEHLMFSLIDLLEVLVKDLADDRFYGLTSAIGDNILHISHPMVLNNLIQNIEDPEELIFDNTWSYSFKETRNVDVSKFNIHSEFYDKVLDTLKTANDKQYTFSASAQNDDISIREAYDDRTEFYCTLPVQIAYFGHVSFPYYGLEQIYINDGDPVGTPVWPVTSPNVDAYYSWEVCTGTHAKILEGISMVFNGNFHSTFQSQDANGTLRDGWLEAIMVMQRETKAILNNEFGTEFTLYKPKLLDTLCSSTDYKLTQQMLNCILAIEKEVKRSNADVKELNIDLEHVKSFMEKGIDYLKSSDYSREDTDEYSLKREIDDAIKYCEVILNAQTKED